MISQQKGFEADLSQSEIVRFDYIIRKALKVCEKES